MTSDNSQAFIPNGFVVNGNIQIKEELIHKGKIIGDIQSTNKLTLENKAVVEGNVSVDSLFLESGEITGDVNCFSKVETLVDSHIKGNIIAESASLAGLVEGNITVKNLVYLSESALILGNIEASSIQVEAGAKITGQVIIKG